MEEVIKTILALIGCWQLGKWTGKGITAFTIWWRNREIVIKRRRERYARKVMKWQIKYSATDAMLKERDK